MSIVISSLIDYCRLGKVEDVKKILSNYKLSESQESLKGYVLICEALKNKQIEVAKLLLQNEAKINNVGSERKYDTPLHYAVSLKNLELLEILLNKNANVNAKNKKKKTPLHVAVNQKNEEIVKILLERGAEVESTDKCGRTPLHTAVIVKNFDIVKLLIQNGAIDNLDLISYYQLLFLSVSHSRSDILQFLLENQLKINRNTTFICDNFEMKLIETVQLHPIDFCEENNQNTYQISSNCQVADVCDAIDKSVDEREDTPQKGQEFEEEIIFKEEGEEKKRFKKEEEERERFKEEGEEKKRFKEEEEEKKRFKEEEEEKIFKEEAEKKRFKEEEEERKRFKEEGEENKRFKEEEEEKKIFKEEEEEKIFKEEAEEKIFKEEAEKKRFKEEEEEEEERKRFKEEAEENKRFKEEEEEKKRFKEEEEEKKRFKEKKIFKEEAEKKRFKEDEEERKRLKEEEEEKKRFKEEIHLNISGCDQSIKDINTLLHKAVIKGQQDVIQVLLNFNFDVNAKNEYGKTPMFYAYKHGGAKMCKYLLENGSSINCKVDENVNLLHIAAENLDEELVQFLLTKGADVNATTNDDSTALLIACRKGNERIVKLLLRHKANVHLKNSEGFTALHEAVIKNNGSIVKWLLKKGCYVNVATKNEKTPLHFAAQFSDDDVIQRLLKFGANVHIKDNNFKTPICYAVEFNTTSVVQLLLAKNQNLEDRSNKLAFCIAIFGNYAHSEHMVKIFLSRGFSIETNDFDFHIPRPLYWKYLLDHKKPMYRTVFSCLLKCEPSPQNLFKYQILRDAIEKGYIEIVQSLLKQNANLDVLLENTFMLLHIAIKSNQLLMAQELLNRGANINTTDIFGNTPLHYCALDNLPEAAVFLFHHKVDFELRNEIGKNALHLASSSNIHIAELILQAGANIDAKDSSESTALHIAAENGRNDIIELLLEYGADINAKNGNDETPLDVAIFRTRKETIIFLLERQALYKKDYLLSRDILEIVVKQQVKLHAAGLCKSGTDYEDFSDFHLQCKQEVDKMINCQIGNKVSMYDLLTKADFRVEIYLRNECTMEFLDSNLSEESYPIYCNMLKFRIRRATKRSLLMKLGHDALECVLEMKIPHVIIQKLFSYTNNLDLRHLVSASTI